MKKIGIFVLCLFFSLLYAGCANRTNHESMECELQLNVPSSVSAPRNEAAAVSALPDTDGLMLLLDRAAMQQPHTAGNALRMASLAGELLRWLSESSWREADASRVVHNWAACQSEEAKQQAGAALRLLLDCTLRMTDEELRAFLWDAGWEKPVRDMERDGLLRVTEVLTRALASDYSEIVEENEYFPVKSLQKAEKRAMIFVNTR